MRGGIAAPLEIVRGAGDAADLEITMRTGEAFELQFGKVTHVVLDKTGTLTECRPAVREIRPVGAARDRGRNLPAVEQFSSITGGGDAVFEVRLPVRPASGTGRDPGPA